MHGEIQYISDTFLLERFFTVLSENDDPIKKYALDLQNILGNAYNSIVQTISGQIEGKDSGGVLATVINFLAPAMFFRLHPLLGGIVTGAQLMGFDLYSILNNIASPIITKLRSGQKVTPQEVNQLGQAAIPGESGETALQASDNLLDPLSELLVKEAAGGGIADSWKSQPFAPQNTNPFYRMMSFLSPMRRGSLLVGIIVWFIKTVLLSAGLLAGSSAIAQFFGANVGNNGLFGANTVNKEKSESVNVVQPEATEETVPALYVQPIAQPEAVKKDIPTGAGSYIYRKNKDDIWYETLEGRQPHEMIMEWAIDSYPTLSQYKDIILRTPSFWNAVNIVTSKWPPGQNQIVIPEGFSKRDDIVNMFVDDVYRQINQRGLIT
jgi:hypothetical protein